MCNCEKTTNPVKPSPHKIIDIIKESNTEWTFRMENNIPIEDGQFMQLSLPKIGEAPISVSGYGEGYCDFTIRNVGKVTKEIFNLKKGDNIFMRGSYGKGWPIDQFKGKNIVVIAGGTGVAPIKSLLTKFEKNPVDYKEIYPILGFKNSDSILFKDSLESWRNADNFHVVYTLDNEEYPNWETGLVTEFIDGIPFDSFGNEYECVVVGPPIMMKYATMKLNELNIPDEKIWVSYERNMSCGVGKCGHCRIDSTYICIDGPVFNFSNAKKLSD